MKLTNMDNYSLSIAAWLAADWYDHNRHPGKLHISATGLLKPVRQVILASRLENQVDRTRDIREDIPNRMGTAIHAGIERVWKNEEKRTETLLALGYPKRVVDRIRINPSRELLKANPDIIPVFIEQRFYKEFEGWIIDGEVDFIGEGILEDFKSTGVYGYMKSNNDEKYIQQGSIYRWLAPDIITADFIRIQHIFTDWSKLDSIIKKKAGYPDSRIIAKKLQLMSLGETENFIRNKLQNLQHYWNKPEMELPYCTVDELWQSPTVYKYYTNADATRATKVFDTYAEAHEMFMTKGAKGIVREVPGKIKRCAYCEGYELCSQAAEYRASGILELSK